MNENEASTIMVLIVVLGIIGAMVAGGFHYREMAKVKQCSENANLLYFNQEHNAVVK